MEKKIDIIIPVYQARDTLFQTLASIASQQLRDHILVTLVNDACPTGSYKNMVDVFQHMFDIQEIILEKNQGPASARQIGLDNTNGEYIVFVDADDQLCNIGGLLSMYEEMTQNPEAIMVLGRIAHEINPFQWIECECNNSSWVFGKMYRRSIIDKYKVRFKMGSRACEDIGFSTILTLIASTNLQARIMIHDFVYLWQYNPTSITRSNDHLFQYREGALGWVENIIYAYRHIMDNNIPVDLDAVYTYICSWSMQAYLQYNDIYQYKPEYLSKTWEAHKLLYDTCILPHICDIPEKKWREVYVRVMSESCATGMVMLEQLVLQISYPQFMQTLHEGVSPLVSEPSES